MDDAVAAAASRDDPYRRQRFVLQCAGVDYEFDKHWFVKTSM
jgi:hypothetical protein